MVVINPSSTPRPSFNNTWTTGARQLVVQLALETVWCLDGSYFVWFTPSTIVMSSPLAGAVMSTFFAPAVMWPLAFSASVNRPVDSTTRSTPSAFHGNAAGPSRTERHLIFRPLTTSTSSSATEGLDFSLVTVPLNRPCVESYFTKYARLSAGTMSLTAMTLISLPGNPWSQIARNTRRPMRPNPLVTNLIAMIEVLLETTAASFSRGQTRNSGRILTNRAIASKENVPKLLAGAQRQC